MAGRLGFIGLGVMGLPMARNLLAAGYEVVAHSRSPGSVEEIAAAGAERADGPAAVAAASDLTVLMLPDDPAVEQVVEGRGGVRDGAAPGHLLVDMSTVSPARAARNAAVMAETGGSALGEPPDPWPRRRGSLGAADLRGGARAAPHQRRRMIDAAASTLWEAWSTGAVLAGLRDGQRPADMAGAYAIQARLDEHAGRRVGWKIAATGAGGRAALGVEHPLAGPLYGRFEDAAGDEVDFSRFRMRTAEAEFGFRLAKDLPAELAPFDRAAILDALGAFVPAIEMPDTRYEDHRSAGGPQLVADAACAGRFAFGAAVEDYDPESLPSHPVTLTSQHKGVVEGTGAKVLGDPVEAVRWLANELALHARGLAVGDVVITGAAAAMRDPGDGWLVADFDALGTLELTLCR